MGWRDLLQKENEEIVAPWVGGRSLLAQKRVWKLGTLPPEHGWHRFKVDRARRASWLSSCDSYPDSLIQVVIGYLVGDRFVPQDASALADPSSLTLCYERVHLVEPGLERFSRVSAGRTWERGPLIFRSSEFPMGPEPDVLRVYLDRGEALEGIPGVPPALELAFRMETTWRQEAEERRRKEQERREQEERRRQIVERLGDAAGRRDVARMDFGEAARSALAVGGAEYLDHRPAFARGEMLVRFRVDRRRFSCICRAATLQILDAGICLTDHDTRVKGDQLFTLESLPSVIREADRRNVLVVTRHEDDNYNRVEDDDPEDLED